MRGLVGTYNFPVENEPVVKIGTVTDAVGVRTPYLHQG